MRVCVEPDCPNLQPETRCLTHRRAREQARGTRQARGYDAAHVQLRATYQQFMDAGQSYSCWRCAKPIDPRAWTLGHCDEDRRIYHGPECPPCDYATAGRTACPHSIHAARA